MDNTRFDALTRILATSPSRRRLLRGAAAALVAELASRLQVSDMVAASCGTFCNALPPGRARGDCARTCARDPALITACEGDPARLCMAGDGTATCCASDEACVAGTCGLVCTGPADCPGDCTCSPAVGPTAETRVCYRYSVLTDVPCEGGEDCPPDQSCFYSSSLGDAFCTEFDYATGCPEYPCPSGHICIGTLGGPACVPACPAVT